MPPLPKSCPDLPGRVRFNSERVGVRMKSALLLGAGALLAVSGTAASAETLQEALANAYRTNPSLTGARAGLRALDEGVPQAKALGRPTFSVTTGLNQSFKGIGRLDLGGRALSVDGDVNVPVFQGGRVRSAIKAAESRIEAGRSDLRSVEAQTFVDVVAAYLEVIRAQRVVELNDSQVRVLSTNLQATRDRFEVGDLTRTDVAQSEARLAGAQSSLTAAQGALTVAREAYLRVVGNLPKDLAPPTLLPTLPQSADEAVGVALENNPDILSAKRPRRPRAIRCRARRPKGCRPCRRQSAQATTIICTRWMMPWACRVPRLIISRKAAGLACPCGCRCIRVVWWARACGRRGRRNRRRWNR